ncbi:uncharacterized protein M421DRAFT_424150 [Didymella exigua CBS 183.55]|uniref:MYND-type domain-containing protein n=1 Tax=Didymella exigua CBS 183.55 TaxID=1150837 RepID=A0A6A5RCV1_9PLEO|nr:uncharacterized protein M421DRAFT_424150 [Didymella exigua CBS 183.55]KAF1925120.1 hypothetical protein M421DRAFT_424150 [Didymella exigua CBS 183.55]
MADPLNTTTEPQAEASSSSKAPEACAKCGKTDASFKLCNKCHTTSYCGKDCQKAHFKTHKRMCASLAQEHVKNNEPRMASRSVSKTTDRNTGFKKWEFDT